MEKMKWKDQILAYEKIKKLDAKSKNKNFQKIMDPARKSIEIIRLKMFQYYQHAAMDGNMSYAKDKVKINKVRLDTYKSDCQPYILAELKNIGNCIEAYLKYFKKKVIKTALDKKKFAYVNDLKKCVDEKTKIYGSADTVVKYTQGVVDKKLTLHEI